VNWLIRTFECSTTSICTIAAEYGHLHLIQWARSKGYLWNEKTSSSSAWNFDDTKTEDRALEILQWLRLNGCPSRRSARDGLRPSGITRHVLLQLGVDILMYLNGPIKMDVRGMKLHVLLLLRRDI
jgi:hypothetical protein